MIQRMLHILWLLLAISLAIGLAGCGATGTGGSGIGADGGSWPQGPSRGTTQPTATRPSTDEVPTAALMVMLRGKAAEDQELRLTITQIEVKFKDQWVPVANKEAINKLESMPVRIGEKGTTFAMLANTSIPRRKYTHLRLHLDDKKTLVVHGEKKEQSSLTLQSTTFELGDWTMDEKKTNVLTITVDGTKATDGNTLPAAAVTVSKGMPTAGISGKLSPALPTARVDAYWGTSKLVLGSAVPSAQDGAFTIANLPAGSYRLEMTTPGYAQSEPRKNPILLEDKFVTLDEIKLISETAPR